MKNQNTKFAIGIPTINRMDLLQPTLEKYCEDFPNTPIYVVDNGYQHIEIDRLGNNVFFVINDQNNGVAGSWNQLLDKIFNGALGFAEPCEFAMILNDDICLGRTESQVTSFLENELFYFAVGPQNWCAWIMPKIIYSKIGRFDEKFFPAYFEDNDYAYRLLLAGFPHTAFPFLQPDVYRNSQTIEKDPSLNHRFSANRDYFIQKWGGEPLKETYLVPFDTPETTQPNKKHEQRIIDAWGPVYDSYKNTIDASGRLLDSAIGEDEHTSVFVLSNCTREIPDNRNNGDYYWIPTILTLT